MVGVVIAKIYVQGKLWSEIDTGSAITGCDVTLNEWKDPAIDNNLSIGLAFYIVYGNILATSDLR